jgi:hypothetical protein
MSGKKPVRREEQPQLPLEEPAEEEYERWRREQEEKERKKEDDSRRGVVIIANGGLPLKFRKTKLISPSSGPACSAVWPVVL